MKPKQESNINNHYDYDLADNFNQLAGGNKEKCEKIIENVSQKHVEHSTHLDGEVMGDLRHVNKIINIGDLERPAIDVKKLLIPLHVDRTLYQTEEELFKALTDWWVNIKHRSPKTITIRIRHARNMSRHQIYPVNWLEFQPEQILNQMLFRQIYEYPEMAKEKGNPTYGSTQINNLWKTVKTFAESFGIDISYWGYSPPEPPEPQVKIVPRPKTVNKLIHNRYTWDYYTNALIKTILTVGFNAGLRPEELIIIKVSDVKFEEGYILIREQKKRFRERQIWIEDSVMNSRQQNSLGNWVNIWRKKEESKLSGDILFIQKGGKPFPSEDALRMFLSPYCKQVWNEFCPKIMRDWSAIARLIRTKVETKKWDTRTVKNALGHKYEKTTESYIKFAEDYYRNDPYDWLRSVLKFHLNSKKMRQHCSSSQENTVTLTNGKKWFIEELVSPVENDEPGGMCIFLSCWLERMNAIFLSFVLAVDFRPLNKPFFSFFIFVRILIFNFNFSDSQNFEICEEEYDMNETKEEIKNKIKEADEKLDLQIVKIGNIKYISTEKGVEFLKELQDRFDGMDRNEKQKQEFRKAELQKRSNDELQNAENRIQVTAEMKSLTFYDGVILTWDIFHRLINSLFFDDETEKGDCYKKWIDDRASDILINNVINPFNIQRAKQLHGLFEIRHSQYIP